MFCQSVKSSCLGARDSDEEDALSLLSVSTPRSRLGSEHLFDDFELVIQTSGLPPVGTTRPPLYPTKHVFDARRGSCRTGAGREESGYQSPKRSFKRLVNKPIKPAASLGLEGGSN